jgi:hypothetical protein
MKALGPGIRREEQWAGAFRIASEEILSLHDESSVSQQYVLRMKTPEALISIASGVVCKIMAVKVRTFLMCGYSIIWGLCLSSMKM